MDCCNSQENADKKSSIKQGIIYGLVPHIGCIAFIIGSILGVTVLMNVFKPLLMNRYFFHWLFAIALGFATLSSFMYLRKNKMLSWEGVKKKRNYLAIMYGSTVGINLVLFLFIFPLLANVSLAGGVIYEGATNSMTLSVEIPCPGHAPLISNELKTIPGVVDVKFSFPNDFDVTYVEGTSEQDILGLDVFGVYPATQINEDGGLAEREMQNAPSSAGSCSGGCGGAGTCGGSCGSPSCNYNK